MYAVLSSGGKQYRVEPGSTLLIERLEADAGAPITFDRVLLVGDGDDVTVGTPVVSGATVSGTVLGPERGPKLVIFKFKQKVKYRRRTGHRQQLLRVRIDAISANGREARLEEAAAGGEAKPRATRKKAPAKAAPKSAATSDSKPKAAGASAAKAPRSKASAKASGASADDEKAKRSAAAKKAAATRARKKAQAEE